MKKVSIIIVFCMFCSVFLPLSVYAVTPFTDLENHWSKEDATWAYENGIMYGTSEVKFSPNKTLTRAMAITVLYRMDGSRKESGTMPFEDVPKSSYYYDAVLWGVKNGIINGTSETSYGPGNGLIRQDFATMLFRFYNYQNDREWMTPDKPDDYYEPVQGTLTDEEFTQFKNDFNFISWYAKHAMDWAVNGSIINGNEDGYIRPVSFIKRGELAAMLKRYTDGEDIETERMVFFIDPEDVGYIGTTCRMPFPESQKIEDREDIREMMEQINKFSYSHKEPVPRITGNTYSMGIYGHDSKILGVAQVKGNGLYIGDIYYYLTEEDGDPYSYLPDGWLEKWFE